jgi:hypothetical protein
MNKFSKIFEYLTVTKVEVIMNAIKVKKMIRKEMLILKMKIEEDCDEVKLTNFEQIRSMNKSKNEAYM